MSCFPQRPVQSDLSAITSVQVDRFIHRMKRVTLGDERTLLWLEEINDADMRGHTPLDPLSRSPRRSTK